MGFIIGKIFAGVAWISLTIVQGFLGWIDICDAVLTTFAVWLLMQVFCDWNGWWALALGLAASLIVYIIFKHHIGFWFISTLYSALWGCSISSLVKFFFFKDMSDVWFWIVAIGIAALFVLLHTDARDRKGVDEQLAAEDAAKAGH